MVRVWAFTAGARFQSLVREDPASHAVWQKKEKKDDERKDSSLVLCKEMIKKEMSRDCTDRDNNVNYPFIHSINKYSAEQLHTKHLCDKQNEE